MLIIWSIIFIICLFFLIKSADWLLNSSEKIGFSLGMSPFLIGITIVAAGTSLPELVSSLFAVFGGVNEIVVANIVGSNIANIFLILGLSAVVAKSLSFTKNLIDLDLPLIALSTVLFYMIAYDGNILLLEGILLLIAYVAYVLFSIYLKDPKAIDADVMDVQKADKKDYLLLVAGLAVLSVSANYLIDSVIAISDILKIAPSIISITAVAVGTSLPELLVSVKAALKGKSEVAIGNILGSNIFNILAILGLTSLFSDLTIDNQTLTLGMPVMVIATVLFVISGISKKIHIQEGVFYILIYIVFIGKLFNIL